MWEEMKKNSGIISDLRLDLEKAYEKIQDLQS